MIKEIFHALRVLRPPSMWDNGGIADEAHRVQMYEHRIRSWRWVMYYWLIMLSIVVSADVTLGWGITPLYAGHAPLSSVERIEQRLLEQELLTIRTAQCSASNKQFYTKRLYELLREYLEVTGEVWRMPDCAELVQ